jgi:hypothetical protein
MTKDSFEMKILAIDIAKCFLPQVSFMSGPSLSLATKYLATAIPLPKFRLLWYMTVKNQP